MVLEREEIDRRRFRRGRGGASIDFLPVLVVFMRHGVRALDIVNGRRRLLLLRRIDYRDRRRRITAIGAAIPVTVGVTIAVVVGVVRVPKSRPISAEVWIAIAKAEPKSEEGIASAEASE